MNRAPLAAVAKARCLFLVAHDVEIERSGF